MREPLKIVAARLGVTPSHLCNVEQKRRRPSGELLARLSREYREEVRTIARLTAKKNANRNGTR